MIKAKAVTGELCCLVQECNLASLTSLWACIVDTVKLVHWEQACGVPTEKRKRRFDTGANVKAFVLAQMFFSESLEKGVFSNGAIQGAGTDVARCVGKHKSMLASYRRSRSLLTGLYSTTCTVSTIL